MDTVAFEAGVGKAQKELNKLNRSFQSAAKNLESVGRTMTVAITAPITAMGVLTLRAAANFEEGMNRVKAATGATGAEMKLLTDLARQIGMTTQFSASQAAGALEMLAKNGLNVTQILDGAAAATVKLAQANGAELAPAADVVTDIMNQFGKGAAEMEGVVGQVTGTLIASKFGFDDYKLAIGQAGGVAGKVGVTFEDFNAALAVTSSSFASGSDAGTSFKTFLTKLSPTSKEAQEAVKAMRLEFFDANGAMLSMEKIAANLQKGLGGLSDEARTNVATKIFGTDSMRTALALASGGAEAIRKMRGEIAKIDAGDQAATRMQGFNGAVRSLTAAVEALQIAIGNSGLLEWATRVVEGLTSFTLELSRLNPEILKFGTIAAGGAAMLGPLALAVGLVVKSFGSLTVMLARLAPAFAPIVALVAPWALIVAGVAAATAGVVLFADKISITSDGAYKLSDALRAVVPELKSLAAWVAQNTGWIGRIFDFSDIESIGPMLRKAIGDVLSQSFKDFAVNSAREIDAVIGSMMGFVNVVDLIGRKLAPWLVDMAKNVAGTLRTMIGGWAVELIGLINTVREAIGKTPLKIPEVFKYAAESKPLFEQAGKELGAAFARGMEFSGAGDAVRRMMDKAKEAAFLRGLGNQQNPFPESGTPSIPVPAKAPPPPGGGKGGGSNPLGGGGGDDALKKLQEYIAASERAVTVEQMGNRERAISEALYKAQNLAKEAGRSLTDSETAAITRNTIALEDAKKGTEEKQRLEALAKSTIEETKTAQEKYNGVWRDLNTLLSQGAISQAQFETARKLALENMKGGKGEWSTQWQEFADAVTDASRSVAADLTNLDQDIGTTLANLAKRIAQFALEILVLQPIFDAIGKMIKSAVSPSGGSGGGIGDILGAVIGGIGGMFGASSSGWGIGAVGGAYNGGGSMSYGGPRAAGGKVSPGNWYRINERGEEGFAPNVPGQVISNRDMKSMGEGGGRGDVYQTNNIHPDVRQTARAVVQDMLPMIASAASAKTVNDRKRGGRTKEAFSR